MNRDKRNHLRDGMYGLISNDKNNEISKLAIILADNLGNNYGINIDELMINYRDYFEDYPLKDNSALCAIFPFVYYLNMQYGVNATTRYEALEQIERIVSLISPSKINNVCCAIFLGIANYLIENEELDVAINKGLNRALDYYEMLSEYEDAVGECELYLKHSDTSSFEGEDSIDTLGLILYVLENSNSYEEAIMVANKFNNDGAKVLVGALAGMYYGYNGESDSLIEKIIDKLDPRKSLN